MRSIALAACLAMLGTMAASGQEPIISYPAGAYTITTPAATTITRSGNSVTISWGAPTPPTPGPSPAPTPVPVPPVPPTPVAPIADAGLRVLIIYEIKDLAKYPDSQRLVLYDQALRDYLTANCAKGPTNSPEWRVWDKGTPTASESPIWQKAMARPRASIPWIVVSNGKTGFEGPLPGNAADALALVKQYATVTP